VGVVKRSRVRTVLIGTMFTASVATMSPASAAMTSNTFEGTGVLDRRGREVTVGLVLGCDRGGRFAAEVVVRQGDVTGTGSHRGRCTGAPEIYDVTLRTQRGERLQPGEAEICGDATTKIHGVVDDQRTWCRPPGVVLHEGASQ
jgi:hypothetical protein